MLTCTYRSASWMPKSTRLSAMLFTWFLRAKQCGARKCCDCVSEKKEHPCTCFWSYFCAPFNRRSLPHVSTTGGGRVLSCRGSRHVTFFFFLFLISAAPRLSHEHTSKRARTFLLSSFASSRRLARQAVRVECKRVCGGGAPKPGFVWVERTALNLFLSQKGDKAKGETNNKLSPPPHISSRCRPPPPPPPPPLWRSVEP